jgi:hypothetical protein
MDEVRKLIGPCLSELDDKTHGMNAYTQMMYVFFSLDLDDADLRSRLPKFLHTAENGIEYFKNSGWIKRDNQDAAKAMTRINSIRIAAGFMCMNNLRQLVEQCTSKIKENKSKFSVYMIMYRLKGIQHHSDAFISTQFHSQLTVATSDIQHLKNSQRIEQDDPDAVEATKQINALIAALTEEVQKGKIEAAKDRADVPLQLMRRQLGTL